MKRPGLGEWLGVQGLEGRLSAVEDELRHAAGSGNPLLEEPIKRLAQAPAKRLRPALVLAFAGSDDKPVITAAAAVELMHLASLVHDDIIDESPARRGVPTINNQEGSERAILAGDYLFAKAFTLAQQAGSQITDELAKVMTGLCDGETRELADKFNRHRSEQSYLDALHGKTAVMFAGACRIGAICGGLGPREVDAAGRYGEAFGMAFQLVDDVLDFVSSPKLFGKPTGTDIMEGVYTLPVIAVLAGPRGDEAAALLAKRSDKSAAKLARILADEGLLGETVKEAKRYGQAAAKALGDASPLAKFPLAYIEWSLANLVAEEYRPALY